MGGPNIEILLLIGNALIAWAGWSIRSELRHINEKIKAADESASEAHKRIDSLLIRG